jgi:hypothetical protein
MDDLTLGDWFRRVTFEQRDDGELTLRLRGSNKNIGTVLTAEQEDTLRDWLNERHANRS